MIKLFQTSNGRIIAAATTDEANIELYVNPDQGEKERIRNFCNVDEHTLLSALDPDEVPRVEVDEDYLFISLKRPTNAVKVDSLIEFQVSSIAILLARGRLMLVTGTDNITFGDQKYLFKVQTVHDVLLDLTYKIIQHFNDHLRVIKMLSKELQKKINASMENKHLIQMFGLSESLVYYINSIIANNNVLLRLSAHHARFGFTEENKEQLEDLIIENNQCCKQAEIYSSVLSGLMDARGSIVNNNMNQLIRNLTMINIIFMPLNLIASIGGMSEFSEMTAGVPKYISYGFFVMSMLLIGWLTLLCLRRLMMSKETED